MTFRLLPAEAALLAGFLALVALAAFAPALGQFADQHTFADGRAFGGLPHAMDVLSNLPFLLWGMAGLVVLRRVPKPALSGAQRGIATLFFAGLVITAFCSSWYHLRPDDAGLLIDRCGMVLPFAGLLGLAVAGRVSNRAGTAMAITMLLLGPLAAWVWACTSNVLPWAVVQFGGMLLVCVLAMRAPVDAAPGLRLGLVIGIYALAKLFEMGDHQIFHATGGLVSGHSLKHVAAAFAAWPVISALKAAGGKVHNRAQSGGRTRLAMKPARPV